MTDFADTNSNGNAAVEAAQTVRGLPLTIHAQYVKDLSFENPGAPQTLRPGQGAPQMDISINMDARKIENAPTPHHYEVILRLTATATRDKDVLFIGDLEYGVTASLKDVPEEHHHPLLLIEVPRIAFPFARQIMADVTQNGGYPPLLLNPVDFQSLYLQRFGKDQAQAEDNTKKAAEA